MKVLKWVVYAALGMGILSLAGCNHNPSINKPNANNAYSSNVKTFGMGNQGSFQLDASGKRINPSIAPANQSYYFGFDSNAMRPEDLNALNIQANYLVTHPNAKIRLEGNTDDRGSREYNIGLGWRRDQSVARFLEQQGVKPSQIQEVSYGKEKPIALGDNERAWSLNRRVDLIYTAGN